MCCHFSIKRLGDWTGAGETSDQDALLEAWAAQMGEHFAALSPSLGDALAGLADSWPAACSSPRQELALLENAA
jgi:hypothetical protein